MVLISREQAAAQLHKRVVHGCSLPSFVPSARSLHLQFSQPKNVGTVLCCCVHGCVAVQLCSASSQFPPKFSLEQKNPCHWLQSVHAISKRWHEYPLPKERRTSRYVLRFFLAPFIVPTHAPETREPQSLLSPDIETPTRHARPGLPSLKKGRPHFVASCASYLEVLDGGRVHPPLHLSLPLLGLLALLLRRHLHLLLLEGPLLLSPRPHAAAGGSAETANRHKGRAM